MISSSDNVIWKQRAKWRVKLMIFIASVLSNHHRVMQPGSINQQQQVIHGIKENAPTTKKADVHDNYGSVFLRRGHLGRFKQTIVDDYMHIAG